MVRSPDVTRLGLLFGPLLLLLVLLRLLETTMLRRGALAPIESLLWTSAPLPLLNLFVGIVTYGIVRSRLADLPAIVASASATVVTTVTAGLSYYLAPWWITEWVTPTALEIIRWDSLMMLGTVSVALLLLSVGGWRTCRVTRLAIHVLVPTLMTVSVAGFGYFLATGSPADWQILKYTISNFGMVRELVAGSMSGYHILLAAVPWLWSALIWSLTTPARGAREHGSTIHPSAAFTLAPVILLLVLAPPAEVTPSVQSGSLHRIVRMVAADLVAGGTVTTDLGPSGRPEFDATGLRIERTDSTRTPNIVIVLMESVRRRSTTPYNPELRTMPFLDSLAGAGALVEDMSAVVSYTNKSLVPLYAGIYSRPGRDLVEATPQAIPATGLPTLLEPLGYRSAFFTPATMEFERKDVILKNLGFKHLVGADDIDARGFHKKAYFGFEDLAALAPAIEWARETAAQGHPFFLNFLTLTSHHPYDVPDSFARVDYGTRDRSLNDYYNALRYTDEFLEILFRELQTAGLTEKTVLIVLGDHGEAFQEHMEKTHGNVVWDEALRVPAVLYGPQLVPAGARISGARQHIDLLPTIVDILNVDLAGGFLPGVSLLSDVPAGRTLYHHSLDDGRTMALRRDSLKFMYFYKHRPSEVYNYVVDPEERHDLAHRFGPGELASVELELLLWRKRVTRAYPDRRRVRLYPTTLADSTYVAARSEPPASP